MPDRFLEDVQIICVTCRNPFCWSVSEQRFFAWMGFQPR